MSRLQHLADTLKPATTARPTDDVELLDVLRSAEREGSKVWPLGGGHHVRAPEAIGAPWTWLDMRGFDAILGVDRRSAVIHVRAGATVAAVERALHTQQLTLGPALVDGPGTATVGGLLARHWPWPSTFGAPTLRGACIGLTAHFRPRDGRYHYLPAPRKASGPDLRHLFVGAEGRHGVITEAWLVARRRPERDVELTLRATDVARGARAVRELLRAGALPWRCDLRRSPAGLEIDMRLAGPAPVVALWTRRLEADGLEAVERSIDSAVQLPAAPGSRPWTTTGLIDGMSPQATGGAASLHLAGPWVLVERALARLSHATVTEVTAWGGRLELDAASLDADTLEEISGWPWAARLDTRGPAPDTHHALVSRLSAALDAGGLWLASETRS